MTKGAKFEKFKRRNWLKEHGGQATRKDWNDIFTNENGSQPLLTEDDGEGGFKTITACDAFFEMFEELFPKK